MQLHRTWWAAYCRAMTRVMWFSPALEALYDRNCIGLHLRPAVEETLMMEPDLCSSMPGMTARVAVLVAFGSAKATALERLSRGDPALPASALRGLTVVTDLDAHAPEGAQGEHDDNPV